VATETESKAGLFQPLIDVLHQALRGFWGALDPDKVAEQVTASYGVLKQLVEELEDAVPEPGAEFLAEPGTEPKPGQLSEEAFLQMTITELQTKIAWDLTLAVIPLMKLFDQLRDLATPETLIRYALALSPASYEPTGIARKLAGLLAESIILSTVAYEDPLWLDDANVPLPRQTDEEKEREEAGVKPFAAELDVPDALACVPLQATGESLRRRTQELGSKVKSDPAVGRVVHRFVIAEYLVEHPKSFVVADGRVVFYPGTWVGAKPRLSSLFSEPPLITPAAVEAYHPGGWSKVMRFRSTMRRAPGAYLRPDIADLTFGPTLGPDGGEGWFEIKPVAGALTAWRELHCLYMDRWNRGVPSVPPAPLGQTAQAGTWNPVSTFWAAPDRTLILILPTIDGVVAYATFKFEVKAAAAATSVSASAAFLHLMLRRMKNQAGRGAIATAYGYEAVSLFVGAWSLVLAAALGLALLAAELTVPAAIAEILAAVEEALLAVPGLIALGRQALAGAMP
jgi:hypothetical protein